jgi:hypothetical protein
MKANAKMAIKMVAIGASLAGLISVYGFGCGLGFQPIGSGQFSSTGVASDIGDNGDLKIIPGTKTVAITNFTAVLDNMSTLTGVTPSATTNTLFATKLGSFSEQGSADSVNAPMLLGYLSVGAEICNDLVTQELAAANRRFYGTLNLGQSGADATDAVFTDAAISDLTRRFARQFWQREETAEELGMIKASAREMIDEARKNPGVNNNNQYVNGLARRTGVYICAAMIASTSAYEL